MVFPHSSFSKCAALILFGSSALTVVHGQTAEEISYNFEVKPLLSAKCFACHGADAAKRKGKLRLDERADALEKKAIVAGEPEQSELIKRLLSKDEDEMMPPPEKHSALTDAEKDLLRRWIKQGAKYESHWAFIPPVKPLIPDVAGVSSPIDALIRASLLKKKGWQPAPEADKEQWLRRVTFALTGLPPTLPEIDAFVADASTDAYEQVVDRLLKSPHYGERMAINWLDAARYGDTYGRHEDADSEVWPWREWVIRAFNDNLPYDQFIQWQMAGDMLPGATQDQIVATAFHRLPVMSNESGSDPEEFRWEQVFDRVKTTATTVMGLTLECARCHDHKYDPFTAKEYYQFAAFLNNIDELGLFARYTNAIPPPTTFVYKPGEEAQHEKLRQEVQQAESQWQAIRKEASGRFTAWLKNNAPPGTGAGLWGELTDASPSPRKEALPRQPEFYVSFDLRDTAKDLFIADSDPSMFGTGTALNQESPGKFGSACIFPKDRGKKYGFPKVAHYLRSQPFSFSFWLQAADTKEQGVIVHRSRAGLDAANRGYELTFDSGKLTATLGHFFPGNAIRVQAIEDIEFKDWKHVGFTYDGSSRAAGMKLYVNGKEIPVKIIRDQLYKDIDYLKEWGDLDNTKVADADAGDLITLRIGGRTLDSGLRNASLDELRAYGTELSAVEMVQLSGASPKMDDAAWFDWYAREIDAPCRTALEKLTQARQAENDFSTHLTELMVMKECAGSRRVTPFLKRGDFRQPGDAVQPGTPAVLLPFPKDAPPDRRGLAQWLIQPQHPLTSRVEVNRLWSLFFGKGIVSTPEDFGIRGQVPSNPALLDYLAVHFTESGWDIKALCREIVLSKTYRQSSLPADAKISREDPDNILLARGPSFRLTAEQLRDAALAASGLLNRTIGGRSVNTYQPEGLWEDSGTQHVYVQDTGEKLYRRSLYTFWRRTCPPPMMNMFDAPTREFCLVRRETTLTPLQALALMNDTGFLEAARALAEKLVKQYPQADAEPQRVRDAFRLLTSHAPSEAQMATMTKLMDETRAYYAGNAAEADKLLASTGASALDKNLPATEVASTLLMTRALLSAEPFVCSY